MKLWYIVRRPNMALLKKGTIDSSIIVSNMVFVCSECNHIDIVSDKDFVPDEKRKCPKCQVVMILKSTNTDICNPPKNDTSDKPSQE